MSLCNIQLRCFPLLCALSTSPKSKTFEEFVNFFYPDMSSATKIFASLTFILRVVPQGIRFMHERYIARRWGITVCLQLNDL
jgi:hypothetical protein